MGHAVTLGGERVGSGNNNKIYLHNYERSTHNLSEKFTSTMGVGMLIPFLCVPATRGDKFEIDLSAGLRTIPTKGPLFGSFKLQLDVYQCPWRLYQALLHNNPLAIGLKANQVKFPKMRLYADATQLKTKDPTDTIVELKCANNSLLKYLGISALGNCAKTEDEAVRDFTASHLLAYYDIFKNYYANKQEDYAYTLKSQRNIVGDIYAKLNSVEGTGGVTAHVEISVNADDSYTIDSSDQYQVNLLIQGNVDPKVVDINDFKNMYIELTFSDAYVENNLKNLKNAGFVTNYSIDNNGNFKIFLLNSHIFNGNREYLDTATSFSMGVYENELKLKRFELKNIDDMRMDILSFHQLGQSYLLNGEENLKSPYKDAIGDLNTMSWRENLSGICVKTYQSDLFNNWINTEWIDGENGIAAITAISTSDGKITIDALNFSEKLYNLLNRIAVSGATYEDYLDAAYTDSAKKFCEAPMWVGGMSDEIVFEEIVQTAPTEDTALGTLGGRGNLLGKKKGGKITIKVDEPSWIIGIVSITPRVQYTQGNMWFNTEIDSLQDLHVPALDGIGFQNLMAEQMLGTTTKIDDTGVSETRAVIGKVPAWINYMTAFDKAYGDFAAEDGDGYMILNRNYELDRQSGELIDATTYIDPAKYNYAFAYTKRDAQNFWVQIHSNIKARRLMSAKQIPNV